MAFKVKVPLSPRKLYTVSTPSFPDYLFVSGAAGAIPIPEGESVTVQDEEGKVVFECTQDDSSDQIQVVTIKDNTAEGYSVVKLKLKPRATSLPKNANIKDEPLSFTFSTMSSSPSTVGSLSSISSSSSSSNASVEVEAASSSSMTTDSTGNCTSVRTTPQKRNEGEILTVTTEESSKRIKVESSNDPELTPFTSSSATFSISSTGGRVTNEPILQSPNNPIATPTISHENSHERNVAQNPGYNINDEGEAYYAEEDEYADGEEYAEEEEDEEEPYDDNYDGGVYLELHGSGDQGVHLNIGGMGNVNVDGEGKHIVFNGEGNLRVNGNPQSVKNERCGNIHVSGSVSVVTQRGSGSISIIGSASTVLLQGAGSIKVGGNVVTLTHKGAGTFTIQGSVETIVHQGAGNIKVSGSVHYIRHQGVGNLEVLGDVTGNIQLSGVGCITVHGKHHGSVTNSGIGQVIIWN